MSPLTTFDATPPPGMPAHCLVMDRELASRHPDKGFYLRVRLGDDAGGDQGCDIVELTGECTLPGAVRAAIAKGYTPTHWMETTWTRPSQLPTSVIPASAQVVPR
ncbi:hypothetical protein ABIC83_002783 [Roseateles asaccharophilus]|uniref:hypothetical protein n=1 Tax=Roseateles asaccharophilus TaxID=582607 RepID=UPI00383239C7